MKIAIVGSRNFTDYSVFCEVVLKALETFHIQISDITAVVSGGASGTDHLAERWAHDNGVVE